ncbi:MAG: regulator of chromosome condensation, partial [Acidobacteriaceae bacterium]|nr:regulator of chromosome condensation [Acidobacteriaceae bacterium]
IVRIAAGVTIPSGSIAGHVTRDDGLTAIPGATVSYSGGTATTDASGAYQLTNVPAGTVSLTASATGFQTQAKNATVTAGAQTTLDFALPASSGGTGNATVTGTVTSLSDGHALSGATVTYSGGSGTADSTGHYSIANVVPGTYNFAASQGGYLPRTNPVTVASGATVTSNFQLSTAGKIAGATTTTAGAAISGVTVNISGGAIPTTVVLATDATGHYLTNWIPRGNYTVSVSKTGLTSQSKPAVVSSGVTTTVNFTMQ